MAATWFDLLSAAVGGGVVVKVLDFAYSEYKRRSEASQTAKQLVHRHFDPILKAADELVGKMRSLAQKDFKELRPIDGHQANAKPDRRDLVAVGGLMYLFADFWCRVAILRRESVYVNLADDKDGQTMLRFLESLETRHIGIVDRRLQRVIGEALTIPQDNGSSSMSLHQFLETYRGDESLREWLQPLQETLVATHHTKVRQKVLLYGVVLHGLIDTLDPKHKVTRDRPSYPNKLTRRTRRELRYRIIERYLPFLGNRDKYLGLRDY